MNAIYDAANSAARISYAARVIRTEGRTSRTFDACFEMGDGDAVAAALWAMAKTDARLGANIRRYLVPIALEVTP